MRQIKLIKQTNTNDCGKAAIAMILKYYGTDLNYSEIESSLIYGLTIQEILDVLEKYNFEAKAVKLTSEEILSDYTLPCIALLELEDDVNHYVVIYRIKKRTSLYC